MSFRLSNRPAGVNVLVSNIVLSGDGITNTLSLANVTLSSTSQTSTPLVPLDTIASPWNTGNNIVSFNIQIVGGSLIPGTTLSYRVNYREMYDEDVINSLTVFGNINLIAQNTFGLPADVVALITSRFGSVANFLRLRNQGYI
jgi:hypothetical protein